MSEKPRREGAPPVPTSTYRLQLRPGGGLGDARALAGYLDRLGAGALYTAPLLTAAPGSTHGYDGVDPGAVCPELGGEQARLELAEHLRGLGMGLVADIVPNHMSVALPEANPWWWEVLRDGPAAEHAGHFDIDWTRGPIELPVLPDDGDGGGAALDRLELEDGALVLDGRRYPVAPGTAPPGAGPAEVHAAQHYRLVSWRRAAEAMSYRRFFDVTELAAVRTEDPGVFDALHAEVLRWAERGELAGLRVDHPDGLADPGGYLRRLRDRFPGWIVAEKILHPGEEPPASWPVDGTTGYDALREVCGLFVDPGGEAPLTRLADSLGVPTDLPHLERTAKEQAAGALLAAETDRIARVLTGGRPDPAARRAVAALLASFSVYRTYLPEGEREWARALARARHRLSGLPDDTRSPLDPPPGEAGPAAGPPPNGPGEPPAPPDGGAVRPGTGRGLPEPPAGGTGPGRRGDADSGTAGRVPPQDVAEGLREGGGAAGGPPAQRVGGEGADPSGGAARPSPEDGGAAWQPGGASADPGEAAAAVREPHPGAPLGKAAAVPEAAGAGAAEALAALEEIGRRVREDPSGELAVRIQQTSGMVMAKGVEDTAFYRATRFAALNEVGGDPGAFGVDPEEFHAAAARREAVRPAAMTTLSTHDTKRSEDVRARLAVLSEMAEEFAEAVRGWSRRSGLSEPSLDLLAWQTLVGTWPISAERLRCYLLKAAREAKLRTSWTDPDPAFEEEVLAWPERVLGDERLAADVAGFVDRVRRPGWSNALGQKLLQLTMPGVPDVYQGTELWDLSLVDPDNRRPVDFTSRDVLLERLESGRRPPVDATGEAKMHVVRQALHLRRRADLRGYLPLPAAGPAARHAVAFARGPRAAVAAVATRLPVGLAASGGWRSTVLPLPWGRGTWRDLLSGRSFPAGPPDAPAAPRLGDLLSRYPVALLVRDPDPPAPEQG
ncbi:alpha-amylase family glycosyl hydrolase [Nocardiopsis potens]|uniref:alpha-amylase family glycosyl hydrolase n=1 Tax=Nocardiopsis potens TaxID=1246458 RepID=UPI0003499BA8|nr:alpha-amylase family glycosyl hydrolase [Nocardiopsis potens]